MQVQSYCSRRLSQIPREARRAFTKVGDSLDDELPPSPRIEHAFKEAKRIPPGHSRMGWCHITDSPSQTGGQSLRSKDAS